MQSKGSRVRPGPAARGAAQAAAAPSPIGSAARLALRKTEVSAPAQPAGPPRCPTRAGVPTSLQQATDGAGVLRQEHSPRHREQQLPGLHGLPGHHAIAGHRALPAYRHLSRGSGGSEVAGAALISGPLAHPASIPTHLGTQLQPHAPAPAQEAGYPVRVVVVAAHRLRHLRRPNAVGRPRPGKLAGGGGDGERRQEKGSWWGRGPESRK